MLKWIVCLFVALMLCALASAHIAGVSDHAFTAFGVNVTWIMILFVVATWGTHRIISGKH